MALVTWLAALNPLPQVYWTSWQSSGHVASSQRDTLDVVGFKSAGCADVGLADAPCFLIRVPCGVHHLGLEAKLGLSWLLHNPQARFVH